MTWTTPADLKAQVQRLWDKGLLLAALCGDEQLFPRRLTLRGPGSRELSERFAEVRDWIAALAGSAGPYRIEWRGFTHRILGANEIPAAVWIDTLDDALGFIGKRRVAGQFSTLVAQTAERLPGILPWLAKRPLRALELAKDWPRLLDIACWLREHPRPGIYLRQIDLPGVHSKFIEGHRGVLAEMLDLVLAPADIDTAFTGLSGFCRRYGFREKPARVRFRMLDPEIPLFSSGLEQDFTLTGAAFAALNPSAPLVFITENEINFLAFPEAPGAMVIFGAGYGFENLAGAKWLLEKDVRYWGDIDTHGFAILNQLRAIFPHARSFLMDQETLLAHQPLWGMESGAETATLARLTPEEASLYDRLRRNHWGERIRLEQERIGFDFLDAALARLCR
jgi:hypothetical protein